MPVDFDTRGDMGSRAVVFSQEIAGLEAANSRASPGMIRRVADDDLAVCSHRSREEPVRAASTLRLQVELPLYYRCTFVIQSLYVYLTGKGKPIPGIGF